MGVRGLKITKSRRPFFRKLAAEPIYSYESRRFLWGGDEYDAATVGACWACYSINVHTNVIKKNFIYEHKIWGRDMRQFDD